MNTINKPNPDFEIGHELYARFNYVCSYNVISTEIFNRVFYMEQDGALRQIKITAAFLAPFCNHEISTGEGTYDRTKYALEIKVAGVGTIYVDGRAIVIYESVDSYNAHQPFACPKMKITKEFIEEVYEFTLIDKNVPARFVWNGFQPVKKGIEIEIPTFVKFTEKSFELYGDFDTNSYEGFETSEACSAANSVKICEFNDETAEKDEPKPERTIRLQVEIKEHDFEKIKEYVNVL